jgi:hypothetical protein
VAESSGVAFTSGIAISPVIHVLINAQCPDSGA